VTIFGSVFALGRRRAFERSTVAWPRLVTLILLARNSRQRKWVCETEMRL
jgi:hypothetical protein